jgi:plasmid replication initiation protein
MAGERPTTSECATLDPFDALAGDVPPRDQRDLMERPFFSLAKAKRVTPILYQAGETHVQVYAIAEHGMATIWDADVLIWAASQILAAQDRGLPTSRFFRFTPYQLLIAIGRATGNREYQLVKGALTRLQSTVIRTTIRHGEHWRRQQFSWITEWEELTTRAGRQRDGWRFELRHLHAKSASLARFSDFALDIRRIVARQPLPGYRLALERDDGGELILMRPNPSTGPVDKLCNSSAAIGTSGATGIGISGVSLSGLRARRLPLTHSPHSESGAPKDSKSESKFVAVGKTSPAGKPRRGSAHRRERTP